MKRAVSTFFSLVILVLLYFVAREIKLYEAYLLLSYANGWFILLSFICIGLGFLVWNYRWVFLFRNVVKTDFTFFLRVLMAGSFFNTVTPGAGIGGEPFRAHYLSKKYHKPHTLMLGHVVGDTFFRGVALTFFIVLSALSVLFFISMNFWVFLTAEILIALVLAFLLFLIYLFFKKAHFNLGDFFKWLHHFSFFKKKFLTAEHFSMYLNKRINAFSRIFDKTISNKGNVVFGLILAFVYWLLNFMSIYFLFFAFEEHVNFLSVIIAFTLANIVGAVLPIPGGIGVVESTMAILYSAMGVMPFLAIVVAFMHRMIYYFYSLFVGGVSLVSLRRELGAKGFSLF